MRKPGLDGACWPDDRQETILRAALAEPATALDAWRALLADVSLDDLWDPECLRLLPLVYRNLRAVPDVPELERLRGVHRRAWYTNQIAIRAALPAIDRLVEHDIDVVVLKGVPLALEYYRDVGARPMFDADVLVAHERADHALDLLEADGWVDAGGVARDVVLRAYHGSGLVRADGQGSVDLHWGLGIPEMRPGDDEALSDEVRRAAVPFLLEGRAVRAPAPTDLVLHLVVHGAWTASDAIARWVADVATVLTTAGDRVDWGRLVALATRYRLTLPLGGALAYVQKTTGAAIPGDVIDTLASAPTTARDRRMHRIMTADPRERALLGKVARTRASWVRRTATHSRRDAGRELLRMLRAEWGVERTRQLPLEGLRKVWRRISRRRSRGAPPGASATGSGGRAPATSSPRT